MKILIKVSKEILVTSHDLDITIIVRSFSVSTSIRDFDITIVTTDKRELLSLYIVFSIFVIQKMFSYNLYSSFNIISFKNDLIIKKIR